MEPQVLEAPVEQQAPAEQGLPPMSDGLRAAFANPQTGAQPEPASAPEPVVVAAPPVQSAPAAPASAPTTVTPPADAPAPDYAAFLQANFGVDKPEALKEKLTLADQAEALRANQRDPQDVAVREMLADPAKARAYFDLQSIQPDALVMGSPEQQRQLLFEDYKLANPGLTGRLAELGFNKQFQAKYGLMESDDPDEALDAEFAKLQYQSDLQKAVPAVKTAQEAAKIAVLPAAAANGPTKEEREAADLKWLNQVDEALKQPTVEQSFQVDGKPIAVVFDTKTPAYKSAADAPMEFFHEHVSKLVYPNGVDQPANMTALMQVIGQLTQPDAIAKSAYAAGVASVGAHVPMERLVNPAPDAPQGTGTSGEPDMASVLSKMRAVSTGR